jgi:cell division protein FtsX
MYYISVELEDDVNEKDAQEVLESIKSMPEVSSAVMVSDGDDDDD